MRDPENVPRRSPRRRWVWWALLALSPICCVPGTIAARILSRHTLNPYERRPGWFEAVEQEETLGRLTTKYYRRLEVVGAGDTFSVLEVDGDRLEVDGGHFRGLALCDSCDGQAVPYTVTGLLAHEDPARAGWYALQLVGDELTWTWLCADGDKSSSGWIDTRYVARCGVVYDATTGTVESIAGPLPAGLDAPAARSAGARP